MSWSESLLVGVPIADEQHRWLVDQANILYSALSEPVPDRHLVGKILEGLMDYTVNHFIAEEDLFERFGYPGAAEHKAQHDQFTSAVMGFLQRHEAGETVAIEVMETLRDWLVNHIMKSDKAYGIYFADHGWI